MAVNQLKTGAFLSYVSIILNNIIGLTYTPFMLHMMGQAEYGLYSLAASVVAYLTVLDLGFANAIVRYTAKYRAEGKVREQYEMFGMFFILYLGISVLTLVLGGCFLYNIDGLFDKTMNGMELYKIRVMMLLMIFNLAFTFPMSIWGAIITAYERFVFTKTLNIIRSVLNPVVMVVMLYMGYRAIGMVVVTTLFNVATLLINWWYCKNRLRIKVLFGRFEWGFFKEVSLYSFWIFLNAIMDRIYWSTGQFVLGMFRGAVAVAVYSVAMQLHQIYMSFSLAIYGVFLPKVTAMVATNSSDREISNLFIKTGRIQYSVMAFILTGFVLFGKCFIVLWAGAEYEMAYWIALIVIVPFTVPLIQNLGTTILQAKNKMRFRSVTYVVIAILSLCLSIPLAKEYGGIGCAVGTSIALVFGHVIVMNIYYKRCVHIDIASFWKEIGKMSVVPLIVVLFAFFVVQNFEPDTVAKLAISIVVYSMIYVFFFWKFSLNEYERDLIKKPLSRLGLKLQFTHGTKNKIK